MDLLIRIATRQDVEHIGLIGAETFNQAFEGASSKKKMDKYLKEHFNQYKILKEFDERDTIFFLAYSENQLAGYAKLRGIKRIEKLEGRRYIELERIYVHQQFQGKKIGLKLIQKCLEKARESKFEILWLFVWQKNEQAIRFYNSLGFIKFDKSAFMLDTDQHEGILMKYEF